LILLKRSNISNLDIGCASSKPGYENVATQDELSRLNYFLSNVKGQLFIIN
jgi:dihydropteroate synthase